MWKAKHFPPYRKQSVPAPSDGFCSQSFQCDIRYQFQNLNSSCKNDSQEMRARQMTWTDTPAVAAIADEAFGPDELFQWIYPRQKAYKNDLRRWWLTRMKRYLAEPGVQAFVAETEEGDDEWGGRPEVVGMAVWVRSGDDAEALKWKQDSFLYSTLLSTIGSPSRTC
jgi:hypothetical protein